MPPPYDYALIFTQWPHLPLLQVRYAPDEVGWARQLSPDHACLAMIGTTCVLRLLRKFDIVELYATGEPDEYPIVGALLQRYYAHTLMMHYPRGGTAQETRATAETLERIIQAEGGACEDPVPGYMMANVPSQCDLEALLATLHAQAGVEAQVLTCEDDD